MNNLLIFIDNFFLYVYMFLLFFDFIFLNRIIELLHSIYVVLKELNEKNETRNLQE